jgi:hypothetical protein
MLGEHRGKFSKEVREHYIENLPGIKRPLVVSDQGSRLGRNQDRFLTCVCLTVARYCCLRRFNLSRVMIRWRSR